MDRNDEETDDTRTTPHHEFHNVGNMIPLYGPLHFSKIHRAQLIQHDGVRQPPQENQTTKSAYTTFREVQSGIAHEAPTHSQTK